MEKWEKYPWNYLYVPILNTTGESKTIFFIKLHN